MAMRPIHDHSRVLIASLAGTAVEYYDFLIYGFAAALVFGPLFFPAQSPSAQTMLSLMTFGIAFFARPVGAVVFGHFGDRVGRKSTLVASLFLMGVCTFAIAFLPTYATAGWIAPALLCLLRFGQGVGLGGEWAGAALLSIENAPDGWMTRFGAMPALGGALGAIPAMGMFLLMGLGLSNAEFAAWGWRAPFLVSALLVVIGLWVRFRIGETPEFRAALEREPPPRVPVVRLFAGHSGAMLAGAAAAVPLFALPYLANTFALAQATGPLGYDRETFLIFQIIGQLCVIPAALLAAWRADRTTLRRTIGFGALATIAVGLLFGVGLGSGSVVVAGLTVCACGLAYASVAPLSAWLSQLYPVQVRYSGYAFAFNVAGIVGGALLPLTAQMMSAAGALDYVGLLISASGLLTFLVVNLVRTSNIPTAKGAMVGLGPDFAAERFSNIPAEAAKLGKETRYSLGYEEPTLDYMRLRSANTTCAFFRDRVLENSRILDCGCGPGSVTVGLAQWAPAGETVGIDLNPVQLGAGRALADRLGVKNVGFQQGDVFNLPFENASFDILFSQAVLFHVPDHDKVLAEFKRVLRPGGLIALRDPIVDSVVRWPDDPVFPQIGDLIGRGARRFGGNPNVGRELGTLLHAAGFEDVFMTFSFEQAATADERAPYIIAQARMVEGDLGALAVREGWITPEWREQVVEACHGFAHSPGVAFAVPFGQAVGTKPG